MERVKRAIFELMADLDEAETLTEASSDSAIELAAKRIQRDAGFLVLALEQARDREGPIEP